MIPNIDLSLRLVPPPERPPGKLLYRALYGSHAHGTATPTSDEDWRGFYMLAPEDWLVAQLPRESTWEHKPDQVFWEIGHFGRLVLAGNPNIVGLLSVPRELITEESAASIRFRALGPKLITRRMVSAYMGWVTRELAVDPAKLTPKRLSHIPRLLYELINALETGVVPVRLPPPQLGFVRGVKEGAIPFAKAMSAIATLLERARALREAQAGVLPEPPVEEVNDIVLQARLAALIH